MSSGMSLMYSRKSLGPRMQPWETPVLTRQSWRLPIQNHLKPSITQKRRNKAKYLTWNSIRFTFVKKTSMPNLLTSMSKALDISSARARVAPDPLKALAIL